MIQCGCLENKIMKLNKEVWKCIPNTLGRYQLSSNGLVRKINHQSETLLKAILATTMYEEVNPILKYKIIDNQKFNYYALTFSDGRIIYQKALTSLLYETFHGIVELDIDNILFADRNTINTGLSNLMLSQKDEWRRIMLDAKKQRLVNITDNGILVFSDKIKSKCISVYNINGYRIGMYKNKNELLRNINIQQNRLTEALNGNNGFAVDGLIYKYGFGPCIINTSNIKEYDIKFSAKWKDKIVIQYSNKGKFVQGYNNIFEASIKTKIPSELIERTLKNQYVFKDSIWIYG